jgi:hypothetical protein
MHELVPEDDALVSLVQELSVERVAELPDHLGRQSAGDGRDVAKRHGVAKAPPRPAAAPALPSASAASGEPPGQRCGLICSQVVKQIDKQYCCVGAKGP